MSVVKNLTQQESKARVDRTQPEMVALLWHYFVIRMTWLFFPGDRSVPKSCADGTDFRSSEVGVIRVSLICSGRRSLPKARGRVFHNLKLVLLIVARNQRDTLAKS